MNSSTSRFDVLVYKAEMNDDIIDSLRSCTDLNEPDMTFLLDKSNIEHVIQRSVYDIATFHFHRLGIEWDDTKHVEFWFKNNKNPMREFHIDCDEYDRQVNKSGNYRTCMLSCILYLSDNDNVPTIITDVDTTMYKYKDFGSSKKVAVSFPKVGKLICFPGGTFYHGALPIDHGIHDERRMLLINLWDKKPLNVPYFHLDYFLFKYCILHKRPWKGYYVSSEIAINLQPTNVVHRTIDTVFTDECYEQLLYTKSKTSCLLTKLVSLMSTESEPVDTIIYSQSEAVNQFKELQFQQRFVFEKHFTNDTCRWMINQYETFATNNGGWKTDRHKFFPTTDLPADVLEHVFSFILTSFKETISPRIIEAYNFNSAIGTNIVFKLNDIFIVKYDESSQRSLALHTDNSTLTVNILLSDSLTEFSGGGTRFEDGMTVLLRQGDMLIHGGRVRHEGLPITQGKRYILVFFLDIE